MPVRTVIIAGALLIALPAMAQEAGKSGGNGAGGDDSCVINLQVENDLFGGTDSHYTQGFRASYLFPLRTEGRERICIPFEDAFRALAETAAGPFRGFVDERTNRVSLVFGQNMFTPDDIENPDVVPDDRPYAGWLYVGAGLESEGGRSEAPYLEKFEINVGVVGPASLADKTQTWWHRLIGARTPRGWHHQLKNEPGLNLFYERKWPLDVAEGDGYSLEFTPSAGVALGNIYTYAAAGAMARFGHNVPNDYGPPMVRPGLQGADSFAPPRFGTGKFGWYVFAGVEGRAVGRNIFLDGNTFADSHGVDRKPLVADFQAGLVITYGAVRVGFTNVFRTREFEGQDEIDEFGSITLSLRF